VSLIAALTADEQAVVVAFLISLLIWLYDVYKPTYDARYAVAPVA
jgi:hypothetical protein